MDNTNVRSVGGGSNTDTDTRQYVTALTKLVDAANIIFQRGNSWVIQLHQAGQLQGLDVNKTYGTKQDAYRALFMALGLDASMVTNVVGSAAA